MTDKTTLPTLLGRAIAEARVARGMTKYMLAKLTGMQPQRITQIEEGTSADLRLTSLAMICSALEQTPGELLDKVVILYNQRDNAMTQDQPRRQNCNADPQ